MLSFSVIRSRVSHSHAMNYLMSGWTLLFMISIQDIRNEGVYKGESYR